jgi:hypothetical protein
MKKLQQQRFEALVGYSRLPHASAMSEEVEWWATDEEELLGAIVLGYCDDDYVAIVLGRDTDHRYRGLNVLSSHAQRKAAREALFLKMIEILSSGNRIFPQGDERGKKMDIFEPIYPSDRASPDFERVRTMRGYSSAKGIISEAMHHYVDVDGNFIEQFQTSGFDARLWELYLFAFLTEEKLLIDRSYSSPDFLVSNGEHTAAIEAVTVQASQDGRAENLDLEKMTLEKIQELQRDYMPIKFGSPLFSKLKKKYWEKEHVAGRPLVFAIADFHAKQSMMWSSTALQNYLYGVRHEFEHDSEGKLIVSPLKIDFHEHNGKKIPSGFFFTENAQNISAVIFSASGTISKFIRMGRVAGFGDPSIKIIFHGLCHKHDENSASPDSFWYEVGNDYTENWREGISLFHNPKALYPLSPDMFPDVAHHFMQEDGQILSMLPEFHPYNSMTVMIGGEKPMPEKPEIDPLGS